MTSEEMQNAVQALGLSLTDIAADINRLAGTALGPNELSRMKRGAAAGGRDPSPVVAVYLGLKLEQARRHELDLAQGLIEALEKADLRLVRTRPEPDFLRRPGSARDDDPAAGGKS